MTFYYYIWYFMFFSFVGWCMEVAYHTICCGDFANRGFLSGPVCPIYGVGAVLVIFALRPFSEKLIVLFVSAVIITSLLEFVTGFLLEKMFHTKWWDYSDIPFNIMGYVCLKFSLCWGAACAFLIRVVLPVLDKVIGKIPIKVGAPILIICGVIYFTDAVCTVINLRNLNIKLKSIEEISLKIKLVSDELGIHISDSVSEIMEKTGEAAKAGKEKIEEFDRLKKQYKAKLAEFNMEQKRIIKAFPSVSSEKYKNAIYHIKRYINVKK